MEPATSGLSDIDISVNDVAVHNEPALLRSLWEMDFSRDAGVLLDTLWEMALRTHIVSPLTERGKGLRKVFPDTPTRRSSCLASRGFCSYRLEAVQSSAATSSTRCYFVR